MKRWEKFVKKGFGPHLILDGYECNKHKISNMEFIYKFLDELPSKIDMRKIGRPDVDKIFDDEMKEDYGISGIVLIYESHIAIHTFPKKNILFLDIFSCKDFDIEFTKKYVTELFEIKKPIFNLFNRGDEFPKNMEEAKQIWADKRAVVKNIKEL